MHKSLTHIKDCLYAWGEINNMILYLFTASAMEVANLSLLFFRFYRAICTQNILRFLTSWKDSLYIYMPRFPCTLIIYHYLSITTKVTFPIVPHCCIQYLLVYITKYWCLYVLVFVHYGISLWLMFVPTILHQNWLLIQSFL